MVPEVGHDVARTKLIAARCEVAPEMAAEQSEQQIDRAVDDEQPGGEEMPVARERKILAERRPAREGAGARLAFGVVGDAEDAGGVDRVVADAREADGLLRLRIVAAGDREHG